MNQRLSISWSRLCRVSSPVVSELAGCVRQVVKNLRLRAGENIEDLRCAVALKLENGMTAPATSVDWSFDDHNEGCS